MGRDSCAIGYTGGVKYVSIHAPAWGATKTAAAHIANIRGFNPRARMGRDLNDLSCPICLLCFNPRARMGRDFK